MLKRSFLKTHSLDLQPQRFCVSLSWLVLGYLHFDKTAWFGDLIDHF